MEEKAKTEALYEIFRSTFNKLTPDKFDSLLSQFRSLQIDTQEKMEGVVNLVFEMAISEPDSCVAYALMCKELALMQVSGTNPRDSSTTNFKKLIVTRCQREFEKDSENAKMRETKAKEIEECTDLDEKQELKMLLAEEEKKMRNRSVGNIRFIGELFKLGMFTKKIMHFCIGYMLDHRNEENLECLSKLLTTVGKNLEEVDGDLDQYFKLIQDIINNEGPEKVSSDVRKILQELIELRRNKWECEKVDINPKTDNQIQADDASSKASGSIHKYSEIRKIRMQSVDTSDLQNESSSMNVSNSEPRPKSSDSSINTSSINQNEQGKERDFLKQPRPKSNKIPNREKRNFESSYDNLETEDRANFEFLYKEILHVSNKSAPQKLETLIEQGRSLQSESQERLLEIIEFILEKATKQPSFSCACAFICKELEFLNVTDPNIKDENANNFGRIIVTRCKIEFKNNSQIEKSKEIKVKEIEECTNPEKKQALQFLLEAEEKEKRIRSLGNIRFIGELFKQGMLTKVIMHGCIKHLLEHKSEVNLETMCKLLMTIGRNLDTNSELDGYFEELKKIISDNSSEKMSLEVLNVIKEVIELKKNKWVSRINDNNNDEIDNTIETSKPENKSPSINEVQLGSDESTIMNNISLDRENREPLPLLELKSTEPRECETSDENFSNEDKSLQNGNQALSCSSSTMEWSVLDDAKNQNISRSPESNLDEKSTSFGNKSGKSKAELIYVLNAIVEKYITEANNDISCLQEALIEIKRTFSSSNLPMLVCEMVNAVIKKSKNAREKISKLLSFLISEKVITLKDFGEGFGQILDMFDVLADNSRMPTYLAEILLYLLIEETHPISELRTTLESLRIKGGSGKLVAKLFSKMTDVSGPKLIAEKWRQSGLQLSDIINPEREHIFRIVRNYKLDFLIDYCENLEKNVSTNGTSEVSTDEINTNQKSDLNEPINRSQKYSFKTSKLKNKSLSVNHKNSNLHPKSSESLKSPSSSSQHEQTNSTKSTNKIYFFKKRGRRFQNRQKQRKSFFDNLNTEEREKVEALYKEMFRDTDTCKSRNLGSLIDLGKALKSESPERLTEIVNLIFEKATQEPSFSVACALMCKELFSMRVFNPKNKTNESLRPLIITRSQSEFEKYSVEEITKIGKLQMLIKMNLSKLGKIQVQLEEEEKKMKTKSVKFIGELFKQGVLTSKDLSNLQESKVTHKIANDQDSTDENSKVERHI